jgi:hypothetical protein
MHFQCCCNAFQHFSNASNLTLSAGLRGPGARSDKNSAKIMIKTHKNGILLVFNTILYENEFQNPQISFYFSSSI